MPFRRICRRFAGLLALGWLFTLSTHAQGGSISSGGILVLSPLGRPIGGATVTVCAFGATGIPCSPTITVYTDPTLVTPALNPATSDGNGSVFVYAAPGTYTYTVTGTGITGKAFTATVSGSGGGNVINGGAASFSNLTVSGTATLAGTTTFTNHNKLCWAGPGATPTIDQALTLCTPGPSIVEISPGYTGPESTLLVTTSGGYKVFCAGAGVTNVVVKDYRAANNLPGNPALTPIYSINYGGNSDGELSTEAVTYCTQSPVDSTTGLPSWNFINGGTLPTNGGSIQGSSSVVVAGGAITVGSSNSQLVGGDCEAWNQVVSSDIPLQSLTACNAQVLFNRSALGVNVLTARAHHASNLSFSGGATGSVTDFYGFDADPASGASQRNYSGHFGGNVMFENNAAIDAGDVGTAYTITASPTGATSSGQIVTITTSIVCTLVTGQHVNIAGVGVAAYNGNFIVRSPGCNGGSSFTYYDYGTNNLAGSGAGTATGTIPRRAILWRTDNATQFLPLTDAAGWYFTKQDSTHLFDINSNALTSRIIHLFASNVDPSTAGGTQQLGEGSLPWGKLVLGTAATNNFSLVPAATAAARTINIPDPLQATTTLPLVIANGTKALNTASITTATCDGGAAVTATGTLSNDAVDWSFNAAPTATNKYGAFLVVYAVPSANTVTFYTCNPSATTSTPTAMTVNWSVRRP